MTNDFKPLGSDMTKIQKRQTNKSYEIYLPLYQAVTGSEEEDTRAQICRKTAIPKILPVQ